MQYDPKDIPTFKEEVCKSTCILNGKCIDEGKDNHWFLMCPHYHSWKLGYTSFIWEQMKWLEEHPEEAEKKRKQNLELSKKLKEKKKRTKKSDKKI